MGGKGGEDKRGDGKGTGREGTPQYFIAPQFQFSRNMPGIVCWGSI